MTISIYTHVSPVRITWCTINHLAGSLCVEIEAISHAVQGTGVALSWIKSKNIQTSFFKSYFTCRRMLNQQENLHVLRIKGVDKKISICMFFKKNLKKDRFSFKLKMGFGLNLK